MTEADLPVLSVVVPAYNHGRFIAAALESVCAQTYRGPLELIVIDDASTDDTHDIARRVLEQLRSQRTWAGLSLVKHDANRGAHATLTEAISVASGTYIAVLNSDDRFAATRLEALVGALRESGSEFGFTYVTAIGEDGRALHDDAIVAEIRRFLDEKVPQLPSLEFGFLRHQLAISAGNMVFTRRLYDRIGGFSPLRYVHDWDFALAAILLTQPILVPEELYAYRIHTSNSYAKLAAIAEIETEVVFKRFFHRLLQGRVTNRCAPSPRNWPGVFEQCLENVGADSYWRDLVEPLPRYVRR